MPAQRKCLKNADKSTVLRKNVIFGLPTELIVMVLDMIDDEDLLSLSLLCRQLHYLALPILMSRLDGWRYPRKSIFLYNRPPIYLRAARIALFLQDLTAIVVNLSCLDPLRLFPTLKGLARLILRMRRVKAISFSLLPTWKPADNTEIVNGFKQIAEALVSKGCEELTLEGCPFLPGHNVGPHSKISPLMTLRSFHARCATFSHPPLRSWIIDSINISPITNLTLHDAAFSKAPSDFGKDLRFLTLPSLAILSITSPKDLQFCDLLAFLCRHSGIKDLTLKCEAAISAKSPAPPDDSLPVLSTLRTSPQYVVHLLRPPNSLPSLTHVVIDPNFPIWDPHDGEPSNKSRFVQVDNSLASVASRRNVTSLGLYLPLDQSAETWLMSGSHPRQGKRRDIECSLKYIDTLAVCGTIGGRVSPRTIPLMPKWVSLFPALRHANFGILLGQLSYAEEDKFLRAVIDACPELETVGLVWRMSVVDLSSRERND
jgi:hypothetical protein